MNKLIVFCASLATSLLVSCGEDEPLVTEGENQANSTIITDLRNSVFSRVQAGPLMYSCENEFLLVAGQNINAGSIKIDVGEELINITYNTKEGWLLRKTHLYVGTEADLPLNYSGNPQIGQFNYQESHDPLLTSFTYTINRSELEYNIKNDCSYGLVIATHAEVLLKDESGGVVQEETAWGAGNKEFPGQRWGWYFDGCLSTASPSVSISGDGVICEGETSKITLSFSGEPPFNFAFSDPTGSTAMIENTGAEFELEISMAGRYEVNMIGDNSNCPGGTGAFFDLTSKSAPQLESVTGQETILCLEDENQLNDKAEVTFTFNGTPPFTGQINGEIFNADNNFYSFLAGPGTYLLTSLSDINGCAYSEFIEEFVVLEECDSVDEDEDDGDDDDETECGIHHDYIDGYCTIHHSAFAFGENKAQCFPGFGFPNYGWTNKIFEGVYTWDIYANVDDCDPNWDNVIGTLDVEYIYGTAVITYSFHEDVSVAALNAYIGFEPLPLYYGYETIIPQEYPHQSDGCHKTTFVCPGLSGPIYIIAQAEVVL